MGELQQNLRWVLMVVCLLVFGVVFVVMLASMWRHHHSGHAQASNFHGSVAVEICWALAPCVIVVLMVLPTVRAIFGK
ncbi:MAG: hypothetical protein NTU86_05810 [Burkholderiales bacterium]|nr:hypothetical protein [Burkholderiales bacterium]